MRKITGLSPTTWLTIQKVFSQVFGVLLFAIQAPLLGPRAFGLVSIVLAFVGFSEIILGDAAAEALISFRKIEAIHYDTMNTVNVVVASVFGVSAFVCAGLIAHAFGEPELASLMRWMSVLPVISSLAATPTAATKRDMQFQPLALRSMLSLFIGGMIGLVLTLIGFGVWALVWQAIATRSVATIVMWRAVPIRLGFRFSGGHLRELLVFAGPVMASRMLAWGAGQLPRLIFGAFWGATELGIWGLASRLADILMEVAVVPRYVVARVGLRRFATDRDGLIVAFGKTVRETSIVVFPLCVGGAAVVPTLFAAWLDQRWYQGIIPAELMMLMCAPFVTHYCVGAVLLALNRQVAEAVSSAIQTAVTLVIVALSAPLGLVPAAAASAARGVLFLPLSATLLSKQCAVPPRVIFAAQYPAAAAAVAMGIAVTGVRLGLEPYLKSAFLLPILVGTGALVYAAMISLLLPGTIKQFLRGLRV